MKRAKAVKMWSELGDARPRLGDFEDYMNRPMRRGPHGFLRFGDVYEYLTRGEYWWMGSGGGQTPRNACFTGLSAISTR